jgi:mRNA-degrading endonuclease YafQ of YafQ-DinJ toxin-antitoxin module
MKPIKYSALFRQHYRQRIAHDDHLVEQFLAAVEAFRHDPAIADDHRLTGKQTGQAAFSLNEDYRVTYIDKPDYFLFFDVGTHEQVYQH